MPTDLGSLSRTAYSEQFVQNAGYDNKYNIPAVMLTGEDTRVSPNELKRIQVDSQGNLIMVDPRFTIAMEYDGNNNPVYIGKAEIGTAKDATGWRLQKLTYTGTNLTDIQWAGGTDDFSNIWDNRSSYSYS